MSTAFGFGINNQNSRFQETTATNTKARNALTANAALI